MSQLLLAKPDLPEDVWDLSVGEPYIIKDTLNEIFHIKGELKEINLTLDDMVYPYPTGYQPLVKHLEDKHQAPVIITNGAKQALGAAFYAVKKLGAYNIGMRSPYWALIPPLAKMHGLETVFDESDVNDFSKITNYNSYLCLAPNNPDGLMPDMNKLSEILKVEKIPFIFDAAYYTHAYLPASYKLDSFGDVQIFSISKMLGLSGLRIGYVVCHNTEYYKLIQEYMEAMTVGVGIHSQAFLFDLLDRRMKNYPSSTTQFEGTCEAILTANKKLFYQVDPEVLEVPENFHKVPGMFGWFKKGPKANFEKSKLNIIEGALFGKPGFVRMNLAFNQKMMLEIIDRLNNI